MTHFSAAFGMNIEGSESAIEQFKETEKKHETMLEVAQGFMGENEWGSLSERSNEELLNLIDELGLKFEGEDDSAPDEAADDLADLDEIMNRADYDADDDGHLDRQGHVEEARGTDRE